MRVPRPWGIIANANEGFWERAPQEWRQAAERWRDDYHAALTQPEPTPGASSRS